MPNLLRVLLTTTVAAILSILVASRPLQESVNLLWPGSSWASIACGTQYKLLASQGYDIRHIIGASGGAASAVMMLSDPDPNSLTVLNDTYTEHGKRCDFSTKCWAEVYKSMLENIPGAFERVKEFGKVSLVCDRNHLVLYNFTDAEQAAQAYAASGGGPFEVKGISKNCRDGGRVKQQFPDSMRANHLAYFATSSVEGSSGAKSFSTVVPALLGCDSDIGIQLHLFLNRLGAAPPRGLLSLRSQ